MTDHLHTEHNGGVVRVVIDNPPVNALRTTSYDQIRSALESFADDDDVRALVVTGAGKRAFCAGQDTSEIAASDHRQSDERKRMMERAMSTLRAFPKPVVAALNGPAVGAGAMVASLCDIMIAVKTASLRLPEIDVGVVGGARHTMRVLPQPVVRRMILTGDPLQADEAHRLGAFAEIVPDDLLLDRATEIARNLASKDPNAIAVWKAVLREIEELPLEAGWNTERRASIGLELDFPG